MSKMTATTRAKYNAMQCEDVKKKQQATLEQKYGVTNPRHIPQTPKTESTRYINKKSALEEDGCEVLTSADGNIPLPLPRGPRDRAEIHFTE